MILAFLTILLCRFVDDLLAELRAILDDARTVRLDWV